MFNNSKVEELHPVLVPCPRAQQANLLTCSPHCTVHLMLNVNREDVNTNFLL